MILHKFHIYNRWLTIRELELVKNIVYLHDGYSMIY